MSVVGGVIRHVVHGFTVKSSKDILIQSDTAIVFDAPEISGAGGLPLGDVTWLPDTFNLDVQVGDINLTAENGDSTLTGGTVFLNGATIKIGGTGGGTTVGASGAAADLPAKPLRYLKIKAWNGAAYQDYVIPMYTAP